MTETLTADVRSKTEDGLKGLDYVRAIQDTIDERVANGGEGATVEELEAQNRAMADFTKSVIERERGSQGRAEPTNAIEDSDELLADAVRETATAIDVRDVGEELARRNTSDLGSYSKSTLNDVLRGNQFEMVPPDGRDIYADAENRHYDKETIQERVHNIGTATAGGNTFTAGWVNDFYTKLEQFQGFMKTEPTMLITDHGRPMKWPLLNQFGTAAAVAESGTLAGSDLKTGTIELGAYKIGRYVLVTSELWDDTDVPFERVLAEDFGRSVAAIQDTWFVAGTGTVQPTGVTHNGAAGGTVAGGTTAATANPTFDNLIDLVYTVDPDVRAEGKCCFLMHDKTVGAVAKLKDGDNNYLWRPNIAEGRPTMIDGYPIKVSPNVPTATTLQNRVVFGDFARACVVRVVNSARFERSEDFRFNTDETAIRIVTRVDMKIRDAGALAVLRSGGS